MGCQCTTPVNSSKSKASSHSIEDRSSRYVVDHTDKSRDPSKLKKLEVKIIDTYKKASRVKRVQLPSEFYIDPASIV